MRAATRIGLTFVGHQMGSGIGSANRSPGKEPAYKPKVAKPNVDMQQARADVQEACQEAWRKKQAFWQEEVDNLALSSLSEAFVSFLTSMEVKLPEVKEA